MILRFNENIIIDNITNGFDEKYSIRSLTQWKNIINF